MKKALVALLFVALIGASVFAEDAAAASAAPKLSIGGTVETGLVLGYNGTGATLNLDTPENSGDPQDWMTVNFGLSAADWGVTVSLKQQDITSVLSATNNAAVYVDLAFGWVDLVPGLVKAKIGKFSEDLAHSYEWWTGVQWNSNAFDVILTPAAGVALYAEAYGLTSTAAVLGTPYKNFQFGAAYDSDAFGVHLVYDLGGSALMASGQFTGVKGLNVGFDFNWVTSAAFTTAQYIFDASYDLGSAKVGVEVGQDTFAFTQFDIRPWVETTVSGIALHGEATITVATTIGWTAMAKADFSIDKVGVETGLRIKGGATITAYAFAQFTYNWAL